MSNVDEFKKGSFQRGMGSKAGGFLSQKHFHPTNTKNLSIIFQNKKKAEEDWKIQAEQEKKREEEKQLLKKIEKWKKFKKFLHILPLD